MAKMRLLDLYSGAGGCAKGFQMAGFHVTGVDIKPQPRYCGDEFLVGDALEFAAKHGKEYDVIHASPPCQHYSVATKANPGLSGKHPDLVPATRRLLLAISKPWLIENVVGAPVGGIMLCGSMFGLLVQRHRWFESSEVLFIPRECDHSKFVGDYPCGRSNKPTNKRAGERSRVVHCYGHGGSRGPRELWQKAMGIDWMTMKEMAQAIPPAYTHHLGSQLINLLS
jgi:DNA (cytosine-5)-methyltransferase 1